MGLRDLLSRSRFDSEIKCGEFEFRNEWFSFFQAKRSEELLPGVQFAEYFFMEISEETLGKMTEEEDIAYFREFQTKLLSKPFFAHRSDLRWNLYLILVIESYELLRNSNLARKIEDDSDYARKFITTPDDIAVLLDKEWLQTAKAENMEQLDPLSEWNHVLEPHELTGCLSQAFASKGKDRVKEYLEGNPFLSETTGPAGKKGKLSRDYEERVSAIHSVSFDGFRKHCFEQLKPIEPTKVNLIHGSNGSGKTSAMEAIELALTNDIRRCSEFGDPVEETASQLEVICRTESGKGLSYGAGKPVSIYKELAQSWYGVTPGYKSELNYYFHRFNYFDSEAAYRFALSESGHGDSGKFNYSDNLSRLVFGKSILETQKNWQRYKEEFDNQFKLLKKEGQACSSDKEKLGERLDLLNRTQVPQPIEWDQLLTSVHLREAKPSREIANKIEQMIKVNLLFKSIEKRREEIKEFPYTNEPLTLEQIQIQWQLGKDKLSQLLAEKENKLVCQKQLESERNQVSSDLKKAREQELLIQQSIEDIERTLREWSEVRNILEDGQAKVLKRREMEREWQSLKGKLEALQKLEARFPQVVSMTRQDLLLLSQERLQLLYSSVKEKSAFLEQSQRQLEAAEKLMGDLNTLYSRLQHLGEDFLEKDKNSTICPLCKHDHSTRNNIIQAIRSADSVKGQSDSSLNGLRQNIETLLAEMNALNKQIEGHDLNRRNVERVIDAYRMLTETTQFHADKSLDKPEDQLQFVQKLLTVQGEWKERLDTIETQLKILDELGFNKDKIMQAELFQRENNLYKQYIGEQPTDSFEKYTMAKQKELLKNTIELNQLLEQLNKQDVGLQQSLSESSFEELNQAIAEQERRMGRWNSLKEGVDSLLKDFCFEQQDNLRAWAVQLEKVGIYIELLIEKYNDDQEKLLLQAQLEEAEKRLNELRDKALRCLSACHALDKLKPLKSYTEEFINKNIVKIERFFKLLHTPREFDGMYLDEDGLTLYRRWDRERRTVKAFQMSSGQRTSLALSVMFAVHLAAPNAPEFIIMDEPVANMDDLHLMNLLDLLRDLALSGRQIFFTTANPDVANLFRRKFSFFKEGFTHFEFSRHSGKRVHIQSMRYSPDRESPCFSYTS